MEVNQSKFITRISMNIFVGINTQTINMCNVVMDRVKIVACYPWEGRWEVCGQLGQ